MPTLKETITYQLCFLNYMYVYVRSELLRKVKATDTPSYDTPSTKKLTKHLCNEISTSYDNLEVN